MKKREHIGTVVSVEGRTALVRLKADPNCGSKFSCSCCSVKPEAQTLRVPGTGLEEGDTVKVSVPAYVGYLSTVVVFVMPLVLAIVGFALGARFEDTPEAQGMPTIVGGVAGFALAVVIAMLVNRALTNARSCEVQQVKTGQA